VSPKTCPMPLLTVKHPHSPSTQTSPVLVISNMRCPCVRPPAPARPPWKPARTTIRERAMGAGESWGKGCCRSKEPWGLAARRAEQGPTGVGGRNERKPRTDTHLRCARSSRPAMTNPAKGARCWGPVGCGAPSPLCWLHTEGGSCPGPVESGSDRAEGNRQLSAGGG